MYFSRQITLAVYQSELLIIHRGKVYIQGNAIFRAKFLFPEQIKSEKTKLHLHIQLKARRKIKLRTISSFRAFRLRKFPEVKSIYCEPNHWTCTNIISWLDMELLARAKRDNDNDNVLNF